jgi:hypothetical protein
VGDGAEGKDDEVEEEEEDDVQFVGELKPAPEHKPPQRPGSPEVVVMGETQSTGTTTTSNAEKPKREETETATGRGLHSFTFQLNSSLV